jgi:hypothetical protein
MAKAVSEFTSFTGMVLYAFYQFQQSKLGTKFRLKYLRTEPVQVVILENIPITTQILIYFRIKPILMTVEK